MFGKELQYKIDIKCASGQKILDGIVKTPGATVTEGNRFGGFDVIAPDGRGARFDPQGNFREFLEP